MMSFISTCQSLALISQCASGDIQKLLKHRPGNFIKNVRFLGALAQVPEFLCESYIRLCGATQLM